MMLLHLEAVPTLLVISTMKDNTIKMYQTNPYIIGNPVEGNMFVGREDIIKKLQDIWRNKQQLQSVVLYGPRRMGKTSILRNLANYSIKQEQVRVIYVDLQSVANIDKEVGEVFITISDEIATALQLEPPKDRELLTFPYRTFSNHLKKAVAKISPQRLIIALDEFEVLEELIKAKKITSELILYLRDLMQINSQIAFTFAGFHTLEEMTADYFKPFLKNVIPIKVGFLTADSTRLLLPEKIFS
jgi:AAA+ ATPase superfamily predicted ATPase